MDADTVRRLAQTGENWGEMTAIAAFFARGDDDDEHNLCRVQSLPNDLQE